MHLHRALSLLASLGTVIVSGTVFFKFVEGWSWLDAYFFTVVTISTVGYGNLVPVTAAGKIGTTVLIFLGLGVFALVVQQFASARLNKREQRAHRLLHRLHLAQDKIEEKQDKDRQ